MNVNLPFKRIPILFGIIFTFFFFYFYLITLIQRCEYNECSMAELRNRRISVDMEVLTPNPTFFLVLAVICRNLKERGITNALTLLMEALPQEPQEGYKFDVRIQLKEKPLSFSLCFI